jgi:hypothetical protein
MLSFDILPSRVRLVEDLPFKMQEDLRHILDHRFTTQASRTSFKSKSSFNFDSCRVCDVCRLFSGLAKKG